jgi:predicted ArsR family transcriptional regulator
MSDYRADNRITNHEDIRDTILHDFNATAQAVEVAEAMCISKTTARRHLEQMVKRGWAWRHTAHSVISGYHGAIEYTINQDCAEEDW